MKSKYPDLNRIDVVQQNYSYGKRKYSWDNNVMIETRSEHHKS